MQGTQAGDSDTMAGPIGVWLLVSLGFCISLALLYPGHYPFDSAYQYWQARSGEFSNITPVPMIGLWSVLLAAFGNPASLLCLNLGMFWAGMGWCLAARKLSFGWLLVVVLAGGLSPLILVQMAHLLSDAHMTAVLVLATGLLARHRPGRSRAGISMALALIVYAGCIRQNSLVAVIPLGATAAWMMSTLATSRYRLVLAGALATALIGVAASIAFDRALADERRSLWPMLALWDLAAVSVATDQLLLPHFTHGAGLDVQELRDSGAFDPSSATHLFARSRSGIGSGFIRPYAAAEQRELAAAWWSALREHPREYLAHRLRTTQLVFGRHDGATAGLAYYTDRSSYRDNPPLPEILFPRAHQGLLDLAARLRPTWIFSAWPYLLAHLVVLILAWRGRQDPRAALVLGVTSSALVYAASFIILAPSAELRFVTWPIVSATLAIVLWFAPMQARHPGAQSGGAPRSGPARSAAG